MTDQKSENCVSLVWIKAKFSQVFSQSPVTLFEDCVPYVSGSVDQLTSLNNFETVAANCSNNCLTVRMPINLLRVINLHEDTIQLA